MKQTKTLQQSLQSRISLRRNYITELEALYTAFKKAKLVHAYKAVRKELNTLGDDQRLDRKLYEMVLRDEASKRMINMRDTGIRYIESVRKKPVEAWPFPTFK